MNFATQLKVRMCFAPRKQVAVYFQLEPCSSHSCHNSFCILTTATHICFFLWFSRLQYMSMYGIYYSWFTYDFCLHLLFPKDSVISTIPLPLLTLDIRFNSALRLQVPFDLSKTFWRGQGNRFSRSWCRWVSLFLLLLSYSFFLNVFHISCSFLMIYDDLFYDDVCLFILCFFSGEMHFYFQQNGEVWSGLSLPLSSWNSIFPGVA